MIKKRILLMAIFLFLYSSLSLASDITPPVCGVTAKVLSVKEETSTNYKSMYIMKIEILSTGSIIQEGEPPAPCETTYNIGNINTVKIIKEKDLINKDAVITEGMMIKGHIVATGVGIPPKYMNGPHPYIHIMKEVEIITDAEMNPKCSEAEGFKGFIRLISAPGYKYKEHKISGVITAINQIEEEGGSFVELQIDVNKFLEQKQNANRQWEWQESTGLDKMTIKYRAMELASEWLPPINLGDKIIYCVRRPGFKFSRGMMILDSAGIKYIFDDGKYGPAFSEDDIFPFKFKQESAGCKYSEGNFSVPSYLRISAGSQKAQILPGKSAILTYNKRAYKIYVLESYIVDYIKMINVMDHPGNTYSYIIQRSTEKVP